MIQDIIAGQKAELERKLKNFRTHGVWAYEKSRLVSRRLFLYFY